MLPAQTWIVFHDDNKVLQVEKWEMELLELIELHASDLLRMAVVNTAREVTIFQSKKHCTFSELDCHLAHWLQDALAVLGIELADHYIITQTESVSAQSLGMFS